MSRLSEKVKIFFEEYADLRALQGCYFFVSRDDGTSLYQKSYLETPVDQQSVGALSCGVWQAASAMVSFLPGKQASSFTLQFSDTYSGVVIHPLSYLGETFFVGVLFTDKINPGQTKSRLKSVASKFENYLEQSKKSNQERSKKENSFLFDDISDGEMDKLFASIQG